MNLSELVTDFLEHLEIEQNRSQKTISNYAHYLIEISIVLAVTALLTVIAIRGLSVARDNEQFTQGTDNAKEQVLAARAAAYASIDTAGRSGTDLSKVTIGKFLTFTPGSATVNINTITAPNPDYTSGAPVTNPVATTTQAASPASFELKWGLIYRGYSTATNPDPGSVTASNYHVAFVRSLVDASPHASGNPAWGGTVPMSQLLGGSGAVNLFFDNFDHSKHSWVTVDFTTGAIVRGVQ